MNSSHWKGRIAERSEISARERAPDLFVETGRPVEAGVSLEDDEDDVRRPAHEPQNDAAAQEEPVVVVVVDQTLQGVRDQSLALGDLVTS